MLTRTLLRALLAAALLLAPQLAPAQIPVPPLKARVTDLTDTLKAYERAAIEAKLTVFEKEKGSQVAVLIVPTTQPEAIEQYSIRVVEKWKLGRKRVDDGVLLLIAKGDKKLRIEVGYGLEGAIPDATAKRIIAEDIVPRFKQGDFYGGITVGTDRILRAIEGEPLPPPKPQASLPTSPPEAHDVVRTRHDELSGSSAAWFLIILFMLFGVGIYIFSFVLRESDIKRTNLGGGSAYEVTAARSYTLTSQGGSDGDDGTSRAKVAGIAGTSVGILVGILSGNGGVAVILGLIVFFVILTYRRGRDSGGGWSWGGGSGGGSSGGFFGEGGLFGGGGASGDWGGGDGGGGD